MGDVGDGDDDDEAALVAGIAICLREDGVVVVARVRRIDGDEGKRAQVGAALQSRRLQRLRFRDDALGKVVGDAVRVHGDEADLALIVGVAERFQNARLRHVKAPLARQVEAHEIAVGRLALVALRNRPGPELLAVDRLDRAAAFAGLRGRSR